MENATPSPTTSHYNMSNPNPTPNTDQHSPSSTHGSSLSPPPSRPISRKEKRERELHFVPKELRHISLSSTNEKATCPFANLRLEQKDLTNQTKTCPFHRLRHSLPLEESGEYEMKQPVSLFRKGGSQVATEETRRLLADIGGSDRVRSLCTRFYAHCFADPELDLFMFESDGAAAHGQRLGDWIAEKMGDEERPWTTSGRLGMRQPSHHSAWYNNKRPPSERGRRFKLKDCRRWMRLMGLSTREAGLGPDGHPVFFVWFRKFISHFVSVYERTAPQFTKRDFEWSESEENVRRYHNNGNRHDDL